jgi:hypothetical protein
MPTAAAGPIRPAAAAGATAKARERAEGSDGFPPPDAGPIAARMGTSLYDLTVPVYARALRNLSAILDKGAAFAAARGIDEADLLGTRLIDDMAALPAQVQRACDSAKGTMVRVGGVDNVVFPDEETSIAELQARIARVLAFIEAVPRAALDGKEEDEVILTLPNGSYTFTGRGFVLTFAIPNFFFHVTMAYALLRHRGVEIGKLDYLGAI